MENNQRRGQLAKSVTNIVTQFLNLACHELLYLLQIHDKEYFTSKRHGDVTVHVNKHHGIQDYINESGIKSNGAVRLGKIESVCFRCCGR